MNTVPRPIVLCSLVSVLLAAGCASTQTTTPAPQSAASSPAPAPRACILGVKGTQLTVEDRADAVDVTFTGEGNVDELRRRVHDQAAEYGPGVRQGLGHGGIHGGAHQHGLRLSELPPTRVSVVDIDLGARLTIAAVDPAQRDEVRNDVHEHVARMSSGECP